MSALVYQLQLIKNNEPIRMLEQKRDLEKKLFIARLTNNEKNIEQALSDKLSD